MTIFVYDNATNSLKIDEYSILLVKEFAELWEPVRNKCKEDPTGSKRLRAFRELTYIYLMLDYKSPYFPYVEQQKHEAAVLDAGLSDKELQDQTFKNAYNKYEEILNSDVILQLIKVAHRTLYKTQVFLDNLDFNTYVDDSGRPMYKPKDVMQDIESIAKARNNLINLEKEHKSGLAAQGKVRGDNTPGFADIMM